jgi:predicted SnoaL-like aldol condensation-catalyzing enzyme
MQLAADHRDSVRLALKVCAARLIAPAAVLWAAVGLAACQPDSAMPAVEKAPVATRDVASAFLAQMFADGDVRGAYARLASGDMKQHDPEVADGLAGQLERFAELESEDPPPSDWANANNMILVDGDLFALHHHVFKERGDPGRARVDIWRVANGKIVEHWSVDQAIPTVMAHDNGVGCGEGDDYESARRLGDTSARPTCGWPDGAAKREESLAVLDAYAAEFRKGNVEEPIFRWFSSDYRQHSPVIADGTEGAIAYLRTEYARGEDKMPQFGPMRTVAEGDYVLRHRLQLDYGAPSWSANVDIFRVTNGKISEHWDLKQVVPEAAKNSNGMW